MLRPTEGVTMPADAYLRDAPKLRALATPTSVQKKWLLRGLEQPGGKLPLFDEDGQRFSEQTVRSCIEKGWAEPWFNNPLKPDWLVCKLTHLGRVVAGEEKAPSDY
ncbi:MAG: hypothetical protein ACI9MJ_002052 [Alphaproteobacteria bacterium]|jgi:hypothetical protein